jgi:hypothetical protein
VRDADMLDTSWPTTCSVDGMFARGPLFAALIPTVALSLFACSGDGAEPSDVADHHDVDDERIGTVSSALSPSDTIATLLGSNTCSTSAVNGLSVQLVNEIQCLRPNTFARIDKLAGLQLGSSVMPFLQTKAAQALVAAQKARGTTMRINSAFRVLPAQYILYRWYQMNQRCGIQLAAPPGTSNHESALALDINDNAGWRSAMQNNGFKWLGARDPVHFDFIGSGTVDLSGLSVRAFQRLWNRNHPEDTIAEDGSFGPITTARLLQSPIGGFPKGGDCGKASADGGADGGQDDATDPLDAPELPDGGEADEDVDTPTSERPRPEAGDRLALPSDDAGGCTASRARTQGPPWLSVAVSVAAAVVLASRRRQRGS